MKYVSGGKSITTKPKGSDGVRKLELRPQKSERNNQTRDFLEYLSSDPQALIGEWISIIDKILWKPKPGKRIKRGQFELRNNLGDAVWHLLAKQLSDDGKDWKDIWENRLHPYGRENIDNGKHADELKEGREYSRFLGAREISKLDNFKGLAKNIEKHLYERERPSKIDKTGKRARRGAIEARANSITSSNVDRRTSPRPNSHGGEIPRPNGFDFTSLRTRMNGEAFRDDDWNKYMGRWDIAAKIYRAAMAHEQDRDKYWRFGTREAGNLLFDHYGRAFGTRSRNRKERSRIDVPNRHSIRLSGRAGVLAVHDIVREFYKTRLRTTKKQSLKHALPRDADELFCLLESRSDNKLTNDLIRLGRVLHYEAGGNGEFALEPKKDAELPHVWKIDELQLRESTWFLSAGQAEIKRTEAFVRVWRNMTSQAARSLKYWADSGDELDGDVLEFKLNRVFLEKFTDNDEDIANHLIQLFGTRAKLFERNATGTLIYAANMLRIARNQIFHFRGRSQFVQVLAQKLSARSVNTGPIDKAKAEEIENTLAAAADAAEKLYLEDRKAMVDRFHDVLEGAWVTSFATDNEYETLLSDIATAKTVKTTLPKFNRLLARLKEAALSQIDPHRTLPEPASMQKLENPALKARYVALKLVYERPFRQWLKQEVKHEQLKGWVEAAGEQSTEGARENSDKTNENMVRSRAQERFGELPPGTTLAELLDDLTAATAREMQVQDGYRSVGDNARDQARWIENFRCDVLGRAFRDYLSRENEGASGTDFLLKLAKSAQPFQEPANKPPLDELRNREQEEPEWANALYLILHLCPPDDASMLLHQIRKWEVLEKMAGKGLDNGDPVSTDTLLKVFDTYNAMHDAKFDGIGADIDLGDFRELFENQSQFDKLFLDPNRIDEKLAGTKRGLREMLRFGHQGALMHIYREHPVSSEEVNRLVEFETPGEGDAESEVARLHARHEALHSLALDSYGSRAKDDLPDQDKFDKEALREYRKVVKTLSSYRQTANQVKLVNHVHLHRVMMRVIARLVDYAGLWERDLYFIALAIMKLHQPDETRDNPEKLAAWLTEILPGGLNYFLKQGKLPGGPGDIAPWLWKPLRRFHNPRARRSRNDLAHFNILSRKAGPIDLTAEIETVRRMMKYDRKLKNAVTKSVIEMMHQEGFDLTWNMNGHELGQAGLSSRQIQHLAFMQKQIGDWACTEANLPEKLPLPKPKGKMEERDWNELRKRRSENNRKRKAEATRAQIWEYRHSLRYRQMVTALFEG